MEEWPTEAQMDAGESRAWSLHQHFKWDFVAGFSESWEISALDVQSWLQDERQRQALGEFETVLQSIEDDRRADAEAVAEAIRQQAAVRAAVRRDADDLTEGELQADIETIERQLHEHPEEGVAD
jgi:hypothetical protein